MLKLYNTLTRKTEEFKPIDPTEVKYYSCGPTVYDFAHLGHARTYIFADILERVLNFNGFKVLRVMNITDVGHLTSDSDTGEDKMEKGSRREGKTVWDIAKFYTDDFFQMCQKLNIKKPGIICKATDYIPEMIGMIKILEEKGFTYKISDGIYFDTSKFPPYGKLTGMSFEKLSRSLKGGARVEMATGKKNVTDFALWKLTPVGVKRQMEWDSPWGKGFPGWHIECSAMSMKFLGETLDIHTGGVDHIQIHHANEIAQSEAATGKKFVDYWLHAQHLLVNGEKMSKSLGNFYRLDDVEKKGFDPLALRYLFLTSHYRTLMNFTWESLSAARNAYNNLRDQISHIKNQIGDKKRTALSEEKLVQVEMFRNKFITAVNDDLNIPSAIAVLWETLKSNIPSEDKYDLAISFDEVLGLDLSKSKIKDQKSKISGEILRLVEERNRLRNEKKWLEADEIRKKLKDKGYEVEDLAQETRITRLS